MTKTNSKGKKFYLQARKDGMYMVWVLKENYCCGVIKKTWAYCLPNESKMSYVEKCKQFANGLYKEEAINFFNKRTK
jgi:hypothetical protein